MKRFSAENMVKNPNLFTQVLVISFQMTFVMVASVRDWLVDNISK
jgi:hypothetical protein